MYKYNYKKLYTITPIIQYHIVHGVNNKFQIGTIKNTTTAFLELQLDHRYYRNIIFSISQLYVLNL